jgi:hypothetical protein
LALLLLTSCMVPAQKSLAQTLPLQPKQASSSKAATTPAHNSKAHAKKSAPVPEVPQSPPAPPTLEQQPPAPPQVSYQNGQLAIDSQNATLSQVLHSVQVQTGASIDMPSGAGSERVVATLGPGKPKDVIASLLNGSKFNYVILGEPNSSGGVQKIILLSKNTPAGNSAAVTTAQNNVRSPSPSQAVEPPEDEYPPPDQETENQNQLQPGQPGMPGSEGLTPDTINASPGVINPGNRTPEQMLQELQRMQQQQQQMQQQLNPANQPSTPLSSQPAPMAPQPQ